MANKERAAVVECAKELRRLGDLLDWKYRLLELIITLQKQQTGGKR
ncbi:phorbol-12-myristate-13-acetate-induced protein 1 [Onychostoma macrolepis]|nr:phorbol-12-myristate-13-acetate-induced protein 1 [Onychostoma macrolepis]